MRIFAICFLLVPMGFAYAQKEVVFSAMKDEMNRNLNDLKKDGNTPFYISYSLSNATIQSVNALFGSITSSKEQKMKGWNSRVMVGDYQINDENYQDDGNYDVSYLSYPAIPLEDDYHAIRRFFWIATNNIFEEANRLYKSKVENIKRYELDYPIPDFDQTPVVKIEVENPIQLVELGMVEQFMKELSDVFNDYPKVFRSDLSWNAINGEIYFHNSEGTMYQVPYNSISLTVTADMLSQSGSFTNDFITFFEVDPKVLINQKEMIKEKIVGMISALTDQVDSEHKIGDFYGPVLLVGDLTASFFADNILMNRLINSKRDPLAIHSKQQALNYFENIQKNHKNEERIASSNINIYALPTADSYDDTRLLGKVLIDGEGVVPPDTVLICQNGKIVERLSSRTPGAKAYHSNGHYLNSLAYGSLYSSLSPSNLLIDCEAKSSYEELKASLIENVIDEGLEYGLILKPAYEGSHLLVSFTKVFKDGKEEELTGVTPKLLQENILKRIARVSTQSRVAHNPGSFSEYTRNYSLISPEMVLVKGFEINAADDYFYGESYLPSIPMPKR